MEAEKENKSQTFTKSEVDAEIDHGDQLKTSSQWTRKGKTDIYIFYSRVLLLT